jgi:serine/threonine-protein kinase
MGEVYEAEHLALGRRVAIKVVSARRRGRIDEAAPRFRREAWAVAAIQHPNICDVYDFGTTPDGGPYLVLERLLGETLAQHMSRQRRMHPDAVVEIFRQILSALRAAHAAGIVHRDLKPANVFLVPRSGCAPHVKLVDFGLAKDLSFRNGQAITRPGRACGTVQYMAPEQLRAEEVDERADLFSVGVMLHEALTGRHPFLGRSATVVDIALSILHDEPPRVSVMRPSVPPGIDDVVRHALAKDREERFRTALDMHEALLALLPDEPMVESDRAPESSRLPRLNWSSSTASGY